MAETSENAVKSNKSIVPAKYGAKYKGGGSGELAIFINGQVRTKDGFDYDAFFELCEKNNVEEFQVTKFRNLVASRVHGSQGRARMTLRNLLATIARKNGHLHGLDGEQHALNIPKPAVSGAAAKAKQEAA